MNETKYRIKQLRTENKLSQRALAEAIKCSQKSIDYWEKGLIDPSASAVLRLADYFNVSTDYLLGRENDFGNINVNYIYTSEEQSLLFRYKNLSPENKKSLNQYMEFLERSNR